MKSIKFKEFVKLQRGFDLPKSKRVNGSFPLVASTKIDGSHNEYKVKAPGVVTGRSGSLGQVQYITKDFWPLNTALWVKDFKGNNEKYVYYFLQTLDLDQYNSGAGVPTLNRNHLDELDIKIHEHKQQVEISMLLSNYDDLIENNNRRIAILEDMAQSLYREWFVNFRYPGYQDNLDADGSLKLVDSPLGKIPEGWKVKRLDEVASVNPESISTKNAPSEIFYIDIKSVGTGTIDEVKPMLFSEAPSRARRIVADGDIIWATVRPNRKQYSFICKPIANTIASTGFAVLRGKTLPASYLYSFTTTDTFTGYLVNHATGSAYPAVNSDVFKKADVLVPPLELLKKFDVICSDALSQSEVLKKKNKNLKQQRDMLLPKLISGQIKL